MSKIHSLDLNLLRLLHAIFESRNLTRTGERLGLTQSAVSHALKKLRYSFDDPLVIRQGNELVLTPKAEGLQIPLARWLNDFEKNIFNQIEFDPSTSEKTFHISTTDQFEQIIVPKIVKALKKQAPHIHLYFSKWDVGRFAQQIESGEIDFAVGVATLDQPNLMVTSLYSETFASMARTRHPYFKSAMTAKAFAGYPHILVSTGFGGKGVVDWALEELKLSRDILYKVANFSSAPYIVEVSDVILTAPRKFIETIGSRHKVKIFEPPVNLNPFKLKMFWHVKNQTDAANKWLRDLIVHISRGEF